MGILLQKIWKALLNKRIMQSWHPALTSVECLAYWETFSPQFHLQTWHLEQQIMDLKVTSIVKRVCLVSSSSSNKKFKNMNRAESLANTAWVMPSRSSNTLATWCEEPTNWKRLWRWERLRARGEGDDRGWDVGCRHQLNGHEFEEAPGDSERLGSCHAAVHGDAKSGTCLSDWTTTAQQKRTVTDEEKINQPQEEL